jgi:hypothetical protein
MSLRNRFVLPTIALVALAFLVACSSSSNGGSPPPSGGFTNSDLKGTYVFSVVGSDAEGDFVAMTGSFTANGTGGSGGITGGAIDVNDSGFSAPVTNNPITGGTYTVGPDGRGEATLTTTTPFGNSITVDFVLNSNAGGMITWYDSNGGGSGTLDLQISTNQVPAGTYVFALSGASGINVVSGAPIPVASAGVVALDGSGNATGSLDYNNNTVYSALTINSGSSVIVGATSSATFFTSGGELIFDVYPIDSTHLKFISTSSTPILSGDLFSQTSSSFPSGTLAFTMAGLDYSVSPAVPLAVGGLMMSDGSSTISAGAEDFNDAGTADTTPNSFSGTITASGVRYQLQLNTLINGAGGEAGTFTFAAYPSSGGIQLVEIDGGGVTSGAAYVQTSGAALASTQGYGMNLTAANFNGYEEDDIAEFTTTTSSFAGHVDINDQGQTSSHGLSGNYTLDSPATGRGELTTNGNAFDGVFYAVSNSDLLFLETDNSQLGLGALQLQNATAVPVKSNQAARHMAVLRMVRGAKAGAKKALKRH